jgi:hypothetical protein
MRMAVENRIRDFRVAKGWSEEALALALRTEAKLFSDGRKTYCNRVSTKLFGWLKFLIAHLRMSSSGRYGKRNELFERN